MRQFRTLVSAGLLAATIITPSAAGASMGPATSVTQRVLGAAPSGWVISHTARAFASRYQYSTKASLLLVDRESGCTLRQHVVSETRNVDRDASGNWSERRVESAGQSAPDFLYEVAPVVPSPWQQALSLENGALVLVFGGERHVIAAAGALSRWMAHYQIENPEEVRLAAAWETAGAWRGGGTVLLELETAHRDIDMTYGRFVLPLEIGKITGLISEDKYKPGQFAGLHPQPWSCGRE